MIKVLALLPGMFPLLTVIILIGIMLLRPRFAYRWLIVAFGSLITWLLVLYQVQFIPIQFRLSSWMPGEILQFSLNLFMDDTAWAYALGVVSIIVALLLTEVIRATQVDLTTWVSCLLMASLGLFAAMAGDPMTLAFVWTGIDFLEFLILFSLLRSSRDRERIVITSSARLGGTLILLTAMIFTPAREGPIGFDTFTPAVNLLIILAVGLRLGVFPPQPAFLEGLSSRRSLGTVLRFIPAAAGHLLLVRVAPIGIPLNWQSGLVWLLGTIALLSGFSWLNAPDELHGRAKWVVSFTAMVMIATVLKMPLVALAWSLGMLLPGAVLSLMVRRTRSALIIGLVAFTSVVALPVTPASFGAALFGPPIRLSTSLLIVAYAFLLLGMLKHILSSSVEKLSGERWVALIYPAGLAIPVISLWIIVWSEKLFLPVNQLWSWIALPSVLIAGMIAIISRYLRVQPAVAAFISRSGEYVGVFFNLTWAYRAAWNIYRWSGRAFRFISQLLEGEGGVLWALLWIVLIVTLISQLV